MKNKKIKLLTLAILATVVMSSTPAFAATNTSTSTATTLKTVAASSLITSASKTPAISGTIQPAFNYGPHGGPSASTIINSGGIIQNGDVGEAVVNVQQALVGAGYLAANQEDGYFGSITKNAVENFQREMNTYNKAGLAVDGIVGAKTWFYLSRDL
jgi:peptidoglycan hydrolase-like protein with peptidoglycan-binding domain